jgi:hypothetical protein
MSFKGDPFFLHLLAFDQHFKAGNLRVPLSRNSSIDDVKFLTPLWDSNLS